ncbi:MAG: branched-chain amino acid ABC transporter permease, partial [Pseudomonadota bacterium]
SGLTGLLAVHIRPYQLGKLGLLARPYLMMAIPVLAFALGTAACLEILFHARHAALGDEMMSLFGIEFNSHGLFPLGLSIATVAVSFYLLSRMAPIFKEAWDTANHLEAGS